MDFMSKSYKDYLRNEKQIEQLQIFRMKKEAKTEKSRKERLAEEAEKKKKKKDVKHHQFEPGKNSRSWDGIGEMYGPPPISNPTMNTQEKLLSFREWEKMDQEGSVLENTNMQSAI